MRRQRPSVKDLLCVILVYMNDDLENIELSVLDTGQQRYSKSLHLS